MNDPGLGSALKNKNKQGHAPQVWAGEYGSIRGLFLEFRKKNGSPLKLSLKGTPLQTGAFLRIWGTPPSDMVAFMTGNVGFLCGLAE